MTAINLSGIKRYTSSSLILMALSTSALAGNVQIGTEFRDFNEPYKSDSYQMPYVSFNLNPIEGSPLQVIAKIDYRHMDLPEQRSWNNRSRQTLAVGYQWTLGQFTWAPKVGFRHQIYEGNTRSMEYRFYPGLRYNFSKSTSINLAGWMAPTRSHGRFRDDGVDKKLRTSYDDYTHELELKLGHSLSSSQRVTVSLYHEMFSKEYESRAFSNKESDSLQLRLYYRHRLNDLTLEPYTRIDLTQNQTDGVGNERNQKRNRYGMLATYKLSKQLSILPEIYMEEADVKTWNNEDATNPEKYYMYYGLSFRYSFK
ncbi:OmpG family monomeric porin [Endozoicomonas atrinae]|uniref:OmpG family monomeric porin n=1 Tax=Endozoicomonas atrinae TaxID=1333660 RepID=UPI000AEB161E|nr:OmpG family monomeric porin [Endozoicomonas atrinae]